MARGQSWPGNCLEEITWGHPEDTTASCPLHALTPCSHSCRPRPQEGLSYRTVTFGSPEASGSWGTETGRKRRRTERASTCLGWGARLLFTPQQQRLLRSLCAQELEEAGLGLPLCSRKRTGWGLFCRVGRGLPGWSFGISSAGALAGLGPQRSWPLSGGFYNIGKEWGSGWRSAGSQFLRRGLAGRG